MNTGHAENLGKWYCPIKMRDVTVNQWTATQKALKVAAGAASRITATLVSRLAYVALEQFILMLVMHVY